MKSELLWQFLTTIATNSTDSDSTDSSSDDRLVFYEIYFIGNTIW